MFRLVSSMCFVLVLLGMSVSSCRSQHSSAPQPEVSEWIAMNACSAASIADVANGGLDSCLINVVGDARIVCLGESRHDIAEQFEVKAEFIKRLVQDKGFTMFILEASFPYAHRLNDYLQTGEGNLDDLTAGMPGWFLWDNEELKSVLHWMRQYNVRSTNSTKLKFAGIDIVAPAYALDSIDRYLQKVGDEANGIDRIELEYERIDDNFWPATVDQFAALDEKQRTKLKQTYTDLFELLVTHKEQFIARSSTNEYDWVLQMARSASAAIRMFTASSRLEMGLVRDSAMAECVIWTIDRLHHSEKAFIWAHNVHIAKTTFTMTMEEGVIEGMGALLHKEYGEDLVAVGASFDGGNFNNGQRVFEPAPDHMLDAVMAQAGYQMFFTPLTGRDQPGSVHEWFNSPQEIQGQEFVMTTIPADAFDAVYFTRDVTRVSFSAETLERLGRLGQ